MTTLHLYRPRSGLTTMRALYFIYFAANGVFFTYVNVYYQSIGLSGTQIGLINTLAPLAGIVGMVLWGVMNDRFGKTRLLLMLAIGGAAVSALALASAPTFIWIIPIACTFSLFLNPIIPLLDSTTLGLLGEQREDYGRHRVWGSFGFILSTGIIGFLLQRTGMASMFGYFALAMGFFLIMSACLPAQPVKLAGFSLAGLGQILRQPPWLVFTASVFLLGLAFSGLFTFLSPTMRTMGGSEVLIGWAWTLAAVSEIPVMLFSTLLLRRFGPERLVAFAFSLYALRLILYTVMPTPVWVLPIHVILGSSFGLYWIGAVNYVNELAPAGLKTTSQSLLTSTTSLANVLGAFVCGLIFDQFGPTGLFRILTILSLMACALFIGGRWVLRRKTAPT